MSQLEKADALKSSASRVYDDDIDWRQRGEPDPVDIHVGSRIRSRRILLGKSQEVVAARLGISFQQLQKYESGANRVSASRLFDLAHILMAPISYFFDDMPAELAAGGLPAESEPGPSLNSKMTLELVRDFYKINSVQQRRVVVDLVRAMAGSPPEEATAPETPKRAAKEPDAEPKRRKSRK